jgi:hypothetical protein
MLSKLKIEPMASMAELKIFFGRAEIIFFSGRTLDGRAEMEKIKF